MGAVLRFMPKFMPRWMKWFIRAIIGILLLQYVFRFFWRHPFVAGGVMVSLLMLSFCSFVVTKRHLARLAAVRKDGSFEAFLRTIDRQTVDASITQTVYEQIREYLSEYPGFPLRGEDRLREDLRINDHEDLEDIVEDIARRTGRSLDDCQKNPYYGSLKTVGDLVFFVNAQPSSRGTIS